jgi:hypothetical protein
VDRDCEILTCDHTNRFAPCVDLYLSMLNNQLTYDALRIVGFDRALLQTLGAEMLFTQQLAHAGKVSQGIFVARRPMAY